MKWMSPLVVLAALACADDAVGPRQAPTLARPSFMAVPGEGGVVCSGYLDGAAFQGGYPGIDYGHDCLTSLTVSPGPAVYAGDPQTDYDVTVVFSSAVADLVITPVSLWNCGSDPGSVTAYSPSGASVTLPFSADESQCGNLLDNGEAWYYQDASLPQALLVSGLDSIKRVVIRPPGVVEWQTVVHYYSGEDVSVTATAGTVYVLSFREPLPGPTQARLKLTCEPETVVRGESVTCTGSVEPASASLALTGWTFTPDNAPDLGVVQRDQSEVTQTVWAGRMATGGTVTAQAQVNGVQQSASAAITVTPRDWSQKAIPLETMRQCPGNLPERPTTVHELGGTTFDPQATAPVDFIGTGPNAGLYYFTDVPIKVHVTVSINCVALQAGSAFWHLQDPVRPQLVVGTPDCSRADVGAALPLVQAHEDLHVTVYMNRLTELAGPSFEPRVGRSDAQVGFLADIDQMNAAAAVKSKAIVDESPANPFTLACTFKYFGAAPGH